MSDGKLDVTCRLLRREDRAQWEPLFAGYQDFYRVALGTPVVDTTWERFHDPVEPVFAAGAFADGRLCGIVHYIFHRSTWMLGPVCYLNDLFTLSDLRGRGVGRRLIEFVCDRAREAGATRVYWLTHESNVPGRRLYDQVADNAGFIQYRKDLGS